jgi:hypothetical protein
MNGNSVSGNAKIETLLKREAALKAAIAEEKVRQQKAKERVEAREFATVGEALVRYAGQSPEFKTMLRQVLPTAVTDERARRFLQERGWL